MFNQVFTSPAVVERHRSAPLANERSAYLDGLARQGASRRTLRNAAAYMLAVTHGLQLGRRPDESVSLEDIHRAAVRWANRRVKHKNSKPGRSSKQVFVSNAMRWLDSIGRLECRALPASPLEPFLAEFDNYMEKERGLSPVTRRRRCWSVRRFLARLDGVGDSLANLTLTAIDSGLRSLGEQNGYSRASLQTEAGNLRAFLRYGATRGWCRKGLAEGIKSPRVYSLDSLPTGPSWEDVKRLLALTEGDARIDIRDRAILMLLAIYGLRAGEVKRLRLEDFDWEGEQLSVACSKTRRKRVFPLSRPVGDAVLRYITQVRPRTRYREIFLSMHAPIRPLGSLGPIVSNRLRHLDVVIPHYGPHSLRHACATHLLAEGLSLKQIGDHLGHCDPDATRIYAKVDITGLRQVADFDLGGLV